MAKKNVPIVFTAINNTVGAFKTINKSLGTIGGGALAATKAVSGLGIAVAGTAAAVAAFAKVNFDAIDRLGKTASKLGINVELLQSMRYAAEQTGIAQNTLDMALQRFIRRTGEAAKGTGEAKGALRDLGIQLKNNDGTLRDTRDILFDVAEGIKNTTSPAEQLRLAFKFFDSEGAALVNTLKDGRAGLEAFEKKAQSLGFVLDQQTISATEEFNNNIATIRRQVTGFVQYTLTAFLPVLDDIAKGFSKVLEDVASKPGGFKELGKTIAISIVEAMRSATIAVKRFIAETSLDIELFKSKFGFGDLSNQAKDFIRNIEMLEKQIGTGNLAEPFLSNAREQLKNWKTMLAEELGYDFEFAEINDAFDTVVEKIGKGFEEIGKKAKEETSKNVLPAINTFLQGIGTVEENLGSSAVAAMKKFEDSIVDGIKQGKLSFKDFSNYVVEQLLRIAIQQAILKPLSGVFGNFFSGFGDMFRASGGAVKQGSPYIVGERGAEMFVPNSSGQIITNENLQNMQPGAQTSPVVNFNISTVDAAGFDELLASRKNLITAIINNAMNTKGKLGVV